ncbi:tail fiber protein [uncultured Rhodospira sp.]|uniref:phage tail protein n=1 Tax=uncultured Rhodospira sp. TaxID=1936189 RepID=UPI00261EC5BF|nr:tail fiber protein [uncultured Rhodospira sp.]
MTTRFKNTPRAASAVAASLVAAMGLFATAGPAQACSSEPYMGSLCMTAATFCPEGFVEARGQLLPIAQYTAVYALLGTNYGGDGTTTFGVPDLRGRIPIGLGQGPATSDIFQGEMRGAETRTLTIAEMPNHTHPATADFSPDGVETTVAASTGNGDKSAPADGAYLAGGASIYTTATPRSTAALAGVTTQGGGGTVDVTVGATGGGQSFGVVDPSVGVRFCLAVTGLFPPRP